MRYLHASAIKFHGNLTSSKCVIDSHWVVKITDWGLHEFKSGQEEVEKSPHKKYSGTFVESNTFSLPPKWFEKTAFCFAIIIIKMKIKIITNLPITNR